MIKVNCPSCGVRLSASDDYIGRPVTCQKCDTKFVLSKRWTNEPLSGSDVAQQLAQSGEPVPASQFPTPSPSTLVPPPGTPTPAVPTAVTIPQPDTSGLPAPPATALPLTTTKTTTPAEAQAQLQAIARAKTAERRGMPSLDGYVEARSVVEFFDFRFRRYLTPTILRISWLLILVVAFVWLVIVSYAYVASLMNSSELDSQNISQTVAAETSPFLLKTGVYLTTAATIGVSLMWLRVIFETIIAIFSMCNTLRTIDLRNATENDASKSP